MSAKAQRTAELLGQLQPGDRVQLEHALLGRRQGFVRTYPVPLSTGHLFVYVDWVDGDCTPHLVANLHLVIDD